MKNLQKHTVDASFYQSINDFEYKVPYLSIIFWKYILDIIALLFWFLSSLLMINFFTKNKS